MTTFTKALAAINLLGAVVSIALLLATWFAQGYIIRTAREIALAATVPRLESVGKILRNPMILGNLPPSVEKKLEKELTAYQASPEEWLRGIVEGSRDRTADFDYPEIRNPLAREGFEFITQRISGASEYFRRSYANLILDLRIFCGTNAAAFTIAAWLSFVARTKQMRHWLGAWSTALFVATLLCIWFYIGQSWIWNLALNRYLGWAYASIHSLTAIYLFYKAEPWLQATMPPEEY